MALQELGRLSWEKQVGFMLTSCFDNTATALMLFSSNPTSIYTCCCQRALLSNVYFGDIVIYDISKIMHECNIYMIQKRLASKNAIFNAHTEVQCTGHWGQRTQNCTWKPAQKNRGFICCDRECVIRSIFEGYLGKLSLAKKGIF